MSYSTLQKKLQPANKALKSVAKSVQSKLHSFSFTKTLNVIKTNSHRLLSNCSLHLRRRRGRNNHLYQCYYNSNSNNKDRYYRSLNFSPIYLDQFYTIPVARSSTADQAKSFQSQPESSSGCRNKGKIVNDKTPMELERENGRKGKEKILNSIEDAWREVVAKSPQLRPVDDRAEEFIYNFRQEMRLQKEKSIDDFQERLARGT